MTSIPPAFALDVETHTQHADALEEKLIEQFQRPSARLERPRGTCSWIQLYFDREETMRQAADLIRTWPKVRAVQPRSLRPMDWTEAWRRHFHARPIGQRLLLVPEGDPVRARGRLRIMIHPGLSFGTGEHFTTRFCLETIDRLAAEGKSIPSMLDLGTGSGVLAVAAARLGCPKVLAVDHDPLALESAAANLRLNRVSPRITLRALDLREEAIPGRHALVCANIYTGLLLEFREAIQHATRRYLILSGIRDTELDAVGDAYRDDAWHEITRDSDGEWGGLFLVRKKS